MRPLILLGDPTSNGGKVVQGAPATLVDGLPVVRVGDAVLCSHGACFVRSGDGATLDEGLPVARHGDLTACGATLVATHTATFIV